jgi:hypothetical protein
MGGRPVGSFLPRLTRQAFEKFGFSTASLLTDWPAIVGTELAAYTAPERLRWPKFAESPDEEGIGRRGATLVVRADPARALDVQYKSAQIVQRINAYFGYRAIFELRILQAPVETPKAVVTATLRARTPVKAADIRPIPVPEIANGPLKAALERMAGGIAGRSRRADRSAT